MLEPIIDFINKHFDKLILALLPTIFTIITVKFADKFKEIQYRISSDILPVLSFIAMFDILFLILYVNMMWADVNIFVKQLENPVRSFFSFLSLFLLVLSFIADTFNLMLLSNKFFVCFEQDKRYFMLKGIYNTFKDSTEIAPPNHYDEQMKKYKTWDKGKLSRRYLIVDKWFLVDHCKIFRLSEVKRKNFHRSWFIINGWKDSILSAIPFILNIALLIFLGNFPSSLTTIVSFLTVTAVLSFLIKTKNTTNIIKENNLIKNKFING